MKKKVPSIFPGKSLSPYEKGQPHENAFLGLESKKERRKRVSSWLQSLQKGFEPLQFEGLKRFGPLQCDGRRNSLTLHLPRLQSLGSFEGKDLLSTKAPFVKFPGCLALHTGFLLPTFESTKNMKTSVMAQETWTKFCAFSKEPRIRDSCMDHK